MQSASKILVISPQIEPKTGGGIINARNIELIGQVSDNVTVLYVENHAQTNSNILFKARDRYRGVFVGLSSDILSQIEELVASQKPELVFINHSLLGYAARLIKKRSAHTTIISFFHNVEMLYSKEQSKNAPLNIRLQLALISSLKAERLSVKYSDYIIAMNSRDSGQIERIYGRAIDLLLPTSFEDRGAVGHTPTLGDAPLELLFVGFNFFANLQGIKWFASQVMPMVTNAHLTIVGRGMEQEREALQAPNITVVGSADALDPYYQRADMVVSPIFLGSGMKTKTAEALMYGRALLATREALEGYEIEPHRVGAECDTAEQFISKIDYFSMHKELLPSLGENARHYFETLYSQRVVCKNFINFVNSLPRK